MTKNKVTRKNAGLAEISIHKPFKILPQANNPAMMQEKKKGIKRQIATDRITHKANLNNNFLLRKFFCAKICSKNERRCVHKLKVV